MYKLCIAVAFLAVAAAKPNYSFVLPSYPYPLNYPQAAAYTLPEYSVFSPPLPTTYASQPLQVAPVSPLAPQAYASSFMYSAPSSLAPYAKTVAAPVAPVVPAAAPLVSALPAGVAPPYFGYEFGLRPYWAK